MIKKAQLKLILLLLLALLAKQSFAQQILNTYVKEGLDSNLAIRQQSFDLEKAKLDLDRAKALFLPQVGVNAQYTLASGGRKIDVPLGDLLNSVYSSLNEITSSTKFPQVQNQSIQFLPNDFQDTKIELSVPIYNPSLGYNKKIKEELINTNQLELNKYKRELVFNIKQAYFQYLQAVKAVEIYNNALATVNESLRLNEKLVKNNAATKDVILKAKAEVSKVETSLTEAEQNKNNAAAYFNFLLNKPLESSIDVDSVLVRTLQKEMEVLLDVPSNREELQQLKISEKVLETNLKLNDTYKLPTLNGFYNAGFQGYGYKFNNDQFYQLGGLQLKWNIFSGNDNKLKFKQAQIDIEALQNQYSDAEKKLQLQLTTAYNTYRAALKALRSSNDEVISTKEVYRLMQSRYIQGSALQIELIDARTEMTTAELKYSLAQLTVLNKAAELERVMATYKLD
ncbi:TolC family protein [Panacibacter ginsenosidivorans]|uniref:TolC family protein n=1 Tax=Panacibacter ginsenosidivorans TaxID=1813871 RepID=A0A5B8VAR1_9BACT|nr:TolC family protein [Panacibacter ginsenosidivorans]QEC68359.1 TolC family protein [Panacibacter ginsenosidivorans]